MTNQEIFDKVLTHLRKQGKRAIDVNDEVCMYRGHEPGTSCAAGCLIKDEFYSKEFEGCIVNSANDRGIKLRQALQDSGVTPDQFDLVRDLQSTHDNIDPDRWENQFKITSTKFNLIYTAI